MNFKQKLLVSLLAAIPSYHLAAEEMRQHEAHVHGVVEWNIAQQGKDLLVEIHSPANDIIGFEYRPKTQKEINLVKATENFLKTPAYLFTFSKAAGCSLQNVDIDHAFFEEDEDHHDEHDHHDDHHDDDDHEHHDDHETTHNEFTITYTFTCQNPSKITSIPVSWFKHFQKTQKIQVQALLDNQLVVEEITPTNNVINF